MACRRSSLPLLLSLAALLVPACTTPPNDVDRQLLTPPLPWLAEPGDFGLDAEPIAIELHSEASLTGFWIPHENGEKRTVVLLHGGDTNASAMHPYYRFLHERGFQVAVLDPRGYGKSKGAPTFRAWLYDLPHLFAWLRERPDVDPARIAVYGTGLGSVAAMWAARTQGVQAAVFEHLPSLRAMLREAHGDDGSAFGAIHLGFTEFASLPEDIEPGDNAPHTKVPAFFLTSDGEPTRDRAALVQSFRGYAGPKQLWVLQDTGPAPHGLLTHDGEYQAQIASFLRRELNGLTAHPTAAARKVDTARDGRAWWQIEASTATMQQPRSVEPTPRLAIEACAVLADGSVHFGRTWWEEAAGKKPAKLRLALPAEPVATGVVEVPGAVEDAEAVFRRVPSELARSAAAVAPLWPRIQELRHDRLGASELRALRTDLAAAEAKVPFHRDLEAELGDVFALLGKALAASTDSDERAAGRALLQRAVAAMPAHPERHVWLGPHATYGYPQAEAIDEARRVLALPADGAPAK